ncbi:hypothetical protein [Streptomyces collinus]
MALLDRFTDPLDSARRALAECEAALRHRSRERDAVDYAFTLANKGLAHSRLAASDESHMSQAEQTYGQALDALPPDAHPALLGRIHYNLTGALLEAADRRPEARDEYLERAEASARGPRLPGRAPGHRRCMVSRAAASTWASWWPL